MVKLISYSMVSTGKKNKVVFKVVYVERINLQNIKIHVIKLKLNTSHSLIIRNCMQAID